VLRRRWSRASKVFAILAVVFGVGTFAMIRGYATRLEALKPAVGVPVPLVIAATDLERGTSLTAVMMKETSVPSSYAPPGSISDPSALEGRTTLTDIAQGEPLTRTRVSERGAGPVGALVEPGLRAVTVDSDLPQDTVRAGDHVDVLATYGGDRPHTETVASGLEILLVINSSDPSTPTPGSGPALVLLVTPDDAERLAYAKAFADLSVSVQGSDSPAPA
jgi:pilus assembly protein CpaB